MDCPNCAAEMESRPCKACGWPDSTHPGDKVLRQVARRRARRERGEVAPEGCCSKGCSWGLAFGGTVGLVFSWQIGARNDWTSDGPGMLLIYILVAACGLAAASGWLGVLYGFVRPYLPSLLREEFEEG
jgi:hypothetical protein